MPGEFSLWLGNAEVEFGAVRGIFKVSFLGALEHLAGGHGGTLGSDLLGRQGITNYGAVELGGDGRQQGVLSVAALAPEVVCFQGPDHAAAESLLDDVVNL